MNNQYDLIKHSSTRTEREQHFVFLVRTDSFISISRVTKLVSFLDLKETLLSRDDDK